MLVKIHCIFYKSISSSGIRNLKNQPFTRNTILDSGIFCPDSPEAISSKASAVLCLGCLHRGQALPQVATTGLNRWPGTIVHRGTDGPWAGELGYPLCACKPHHRAERREARGSHAWQPVNPNLAFQVVMKARTHFNSLLAWPLKASVDKWVCEPPFVTCPGAHT